MVNSRKIKLLAKKANERMRQLEKRGIASPAYKSAQARLEMLGVKTRGQTGRRFSETGKFANRNEAKQIESILTEFIGQRTSTITGYKRYRKQVLQSAQERFGDFDDLGITEDEYMQIWEELPDNEAERIFGSDETVQIVSTVLKRQKETRTDEAYTVGDVVEAIQSARSLKDAYKSLGLSPAEQLHNLGNLS